VPHPSVADAEPREVLISAGLQPRVTSEYVPVNTGGVTSLVQLTVLVIVAELPHPSTAVNVLTCERRQPLLVTAPSLCDMVGVLHASVAVAEPREVLISAGLQPSVTSVYIPVKIGGAGSLVHVTVEEAVAELLQPSVALNVLV
jgi:hypothetical protein